MAEQTLQSSSSHTPVAAGEDKAERSTQPTSGLDEADVQRCLEEAEELKQEGNSHFRAKRWNEALVAYRSGLGRLPKRKIKTTLRADEGKERDTFDDIDADDRTDKIKDAKQKQGPLPHQPEPTVLEIECAKARATMNANIGACHVKLSEHKEVVAVCTEALRDDPDYVKALQRRASSNEQLGTWSSLTGAQEDYNRLLTLLPPASPQVAEIQRALQALKPRLEAAQKRETAEMVDKLKGLGNSILGNFGLSTDNFQFVPNGQGGYSMNFVK